MDVVEVLAACDDGGSGGLAAENVASSHACDVTEGQALQMGDGR
jgi:hypothetical protein